MFFVKLMFLGKNSNYFEINWKDFVKFWLKVSLELGLEKAQER